MGFQDSCLSSATGAVHLSSTCCRATLQVDTIQDGQIRLLQAAFGEKLDHMGFQDSCLSSATRVVHLTNTCPLAEFRVGTIQDGQFWLL